MTDYICATCGTQHGSTEEPPEGCRICLDKRQYVGHGGQKWTTLDELRRTHWNTVRKKEPNLIGIGIAPQFAIGQRALLVRTNHGNVLWDCVSLLDQAMIDMINALGGLAAIAISHPHYYTTMVEWSRAFDCPVYLHAADREWVMRPDQCIEFWDGDTNKITGGLTLIRCGGHFDGGTVLHWPDGSHGGGALLTGDIIQVVPDRHWVSFMYSYPNFVPLNADAVRRIASAVEPYQFDRIYGAFWGWVVGADAKTAVKRSADRYIAAIAATS